MKNSVKVLLSIIVVCTGINFACIGCTINDQKLDYNEVNGYMSESVTTKTDRENNNSADNSGIYNSDITKQNSSKQPKGEDMSTQLPSDEGTSRSTSINKADEKIKLPLEGLTICIDAGHGKTDRKADLKEPIAPGSDIMKAAIASGTSGVATKITEASLNLAVSKKLKKALSEKGANILMIRETEYCDLTNVERTELWNSSGADLTIRIHANGLNDNTVSGVLMMVPGNKYIKDDEMLQKSTLIGKYILEGVLKHTKAKSRGTVVSNELTGFNWSKIPVVLLEMGFMTNPEEDKLLNTDSYQNKIVMGIVEGIEKYQAEMNTK
ncbi:N-acetylmuramoyl-L-alanine amidase family protein [Ruminiclostridium herbifermentans]|nr:N-acetylmuramoyl-L-alanine amidase [Ruminiclostridium herbifermentans]